MRLLAGDIGGTSTRLAIFEAQVDSAVALAEKHYASQDYDDLEAIVAAFTAEHSIAIEYACFGIAGPIREGRAKLPNLPWTIDSRNLEKQLRLDRVWLINDLEANAYGVALLGPEDFKVLNPGVPEPGNAAVISAGTGLGEAGLFWDGQRYLPFATEGGHSDFAPRDALDLELLRYMQARYEHVSYERVVSGSGLSTIYQFLRDTGRGKELPAVAASMRSGDPAAVISSAALEDRCPLCVAALALFVRIYGAEAGNLALKMFALSGIFIGGGIAPKILPALTGGEFINAFVAKGRMKSLMQSIPVSVILNSSTALLGAARAGALRAGTH